MVAWSNEFFQPEHCADNPIKLHISFNEQCWWKKRTAKVAPSRKKINCTTIGRIFMPVENNADQMRKIM